LRLLAEAECVIYDRLVSPEILALANPNAAFINAGKQSGQQELVQQEIYNWFLRTGNLVKSIVRLKSGDPMVFGRGGEEVEFLLQHGFEVEVVPGISSAIAAPALAGIPLTYRGIAASFAVIAGHRQSVSTLDWQAYQNIDTLVVLMGVEFRDVIAGSLIASGRPANQPVAFIENSCTPRERVVESTLGAMARGQVQVKSPAVLVIGEGVNCRSTAAPAVAVEARA
jgi:uroporphyrin-III C-methyltransferase